MRFTVVSLLAWHHTAGAAVLLLARVCGARSSQLSFSISMYFHYRQKVKQHPPATDEPETEMVAARVAMAEHKRRYSDHSQQWKQIAQDPKIPRVRTSHRPEEGRGYNHPARRHVANDQGHCAPVNLGIAFLISQILDLNRGANDCGADEKPAQHFVCESHLVAGSIGSNSYGHTKTCRAIGRDAAGIDQRALPP